MNSDVPMKRMTVLFSGRVQGVGFRYTVCRISEPYYVNGYVRNLPTGDVELVAEGEEQNLMSFYNAIRNSDLGRGILNETVIWSEAKGKYNSFGISY